MAKRNRYHHNPKRRCHRVRPYKRVRFGRVESVRGHGRCCT